MDKAQDEQEAAAAEAFEKHVDQQMLKELPIGLRRLLRSKCEVMFAAGAVWGVKRAHDIVTR